MGTFDGNGVFHLGSPSDLPLGNTEFEQRNGAVPSSSLFQSSSNEHRRAVSHPNTSFFTTTISPPPATVPTTATRNTTSYQWTYRDPSGNVQGPFTALEMQEWFEAGYFDHALNVKREDAPLFEPLSALMRRVHDANTPFLASWPTHQQGNQSANTPFPSGFNHSPFDQFQSVPGKPAFANLAMDNTTIDAMRGDKSVTSNASNGYTFHANTPSSPFGNTAPFISPMTRGSHPLPGNSSVRTPLSPWDRPSSHSWLENGNDINLRQRQSSVEPLHSPGFAMNEFQQQQHAISQQMEQQYLNMLRRNQQQHLQIQQRILLQQQQQQQDMFINPNLGFADQNNKNLSLQQQPMAFSALNKGWSSVPGTPTVADSGHNVWGLPDRLPQQLPLTPAVLDSSPLPVSPPPSRSEEQAEQAVNDQLTMALNQLNLTASEPAERLTSKDIQAEDGIDCK